MGRRRSRSRSPSSDYYRRHRDDRQHRSHHHRHRSYDRDRSESRDTRRRRSDRSKSSHRRSRDRRSHSRRYDRSSSRSRSPKPEEKPRSGVENAVKTGSSVQSVPVEDANQFILDLNKPTTKRRAFRFDEHGNEVNEFGEVIDAPIIKPAATLKINRKQQQKSQINPYLSTFTPGKNPTAAPKLKNRYIMDPRIKTSNREVRKKKALNFIKEGTYIKRAEEMRTKSVRDQISQATLAQTSEAANAAPDAVREAKDVVLGTENTPIQDPSALPPPPHNPTPLMEWWDFELLPAEVAQDAREGAFDEDMNYDNVSLENCITKDVIEHPVIVERNKLPPPKPLPLMLTKKERKKERRKNRAEREEEKRIRIQAGLLPKPEQKLTYRNFKQVLGTEALIKPTWADNLVKEQIEKRKLAHQLRNEARKLTPQEASEKKQRKVIGDKNGELDACLFRIESLSDRKQRFKVSVNAQQYHLVGRCLIVPSARCVMLYVEGTKKALRHYKKLLQNRIAWNERVNPPDGKENDDSVENGCTMLWEGTIKQYHFKDFIMKDCDSDLDARKEMEDKSLVQHWDSVVNYVSDMSRI